MKLQGVKILCLFGLLAFFCSSFPLAESVFDRPENISPDSSIDSIVDKTTVLVCFYFAIVVIALTYFSLKYRASESNKRGHYHHGTDKKSLLLQAVVGLLVFFTVDVQLTYLSSKHLQTYFYNFPKTDPKDEQVLRIEVMPQQWAWNFRYAGPDHEFNTQDDIVTLNDMRIPNNKPIILQLKAKDVIHSFSLPNVRLKQDAIPGAVTRMWFQCNKTGLYEIVCAEMCGLNHYKMRGEMTVMEPKDFEAWAKRSKKISELEFDNKNADALWGWKWEESK